MTKKLSDRLVEMTETKFIIKGEDRLLGDLYTKDGGPYDTFEEAHELCRRCEWVEEVEVNTDGEIVE